MERKCTKCQFPFELSEFPFKDKKKERRSSWCKGCHRTRSKQHYIQNREKCVARAVLHNRKRLKQMRKFVWDYLAEHPCVDCGEDDILVLEFDHRRDKEFTISRAFSDRKTLVRLKAEIAKCDVRCANCHRRRTSKDANNWKHRWWKRKRRRAK